MTPSPDNILQFIQATFSVTVSAGEKITLLIFSAPLLVLQSFSAHWGVYFQLVSRITDYFGLCVAAHSMRFWTPGSFHTGSLESTYNYLSLQLPSSAFFVAVKGESFKTAANTPVAQLPEIMLHIKEQTLHCFWQFNLLLELIKMCKTPPLPWQHEQ